MEFISTRPHGRFRLRARSLSPHRTFHIPFEANPVRPAHRQLCPEYFGVRKAPINFTFPAHFSKLDQLTYSNKWDIIKT